MSFPQRKSPRLQDYDYSQAGAYFITICTYEKEHYFGNISDGQMQLSDIGIITSERWEMIPEFYPSVILGDYVVMPNHLHGILFLSESHDKQPVLRNIIGNFKSGVSRLAHQTLDFSSTLWQSRYHDHIIRNEPDLLRIREYVQNNPCRWNLDTFYS